MSRFSAGRVLTSNVEGFSPLGDGHAEGYGLRSGGEQQGRDGNSKGFGCLEIDHQLELGRLLNRKVGWLGTLQDFIDVASGAPEQISETRPI